MNTATQTKAAYWERNKQGNRALGTLYSSLTDRILRSGISISQARLEYPNHAICERKP